MRFIVCDDVVEPAVADAIEADLASPRFPWFFYANVNRGRRPPADTPGVFGADERFEDSFGFSSLLFPGNEPNSPWLRHPKAVFEGFAKRHGLTPTQMIRIKANLLVRSAAGEPRPFTPHVDLPTPHWALIYYVNDSDGDTVILDKTYPDWQNAAVLHSVSPKKGRAILFDGRHYHCGTTPARHDVRIVLNFDFV
ncbi:MAG TPA: hypothetical protein VGF55_31520 [Gemmataceae bacterium]|jgi:hypothetical protein